MIRHDNGNTVVAVLAHVEFRKITKNVNRHLCFYNDLYTDNTSYLILAPFKCGCRINKK